MENCCDFNSSYLCTIEPLLSIQTDYPTCCLRHFHLGLVECLNVFSTFHSSCFSKFFNFFFEFFLVCVVVILLFRHHFSLQMGRKSYRRYWDTTSHQNSINIGSTINFYNTITTFLFGARSSWSTINNTRKWKISTVDQRKYKLQSRKLRGWKTRLM